MSEWFEWFGRRERTTQSCRALAACAAQVGIVGPPLPRRNCTCLYLSDECHLTSSVGVRSLRSADSRTSVPRRARNDYGDRCHAAAGPSLWNSLPLQLREPEISYSHFKTLLKTFLF